MDKVYELIVAILTSPAGAFGVVVGGLLFIFWVQRKAVEIITNHGHLKESCGKNDDNIHAIREDMLIVKSSLATIREELATQKNIITTISETGGRKSKPFSAQSPLALKDTGKGMAQEMDAEMAVARNWESHIVPNMDKDLESKNPYDIQQYCMERIPASRKGFFLPMTSTR